MDGNRIDARNLADGSVAPLAGLCFAQTCNPGKSVSDLFGWGSTRSLFDLMNPLMGEPQQVGLVTRTQVQALAELVDGLLECASTSFLKPRCGAPTFSDLPNCLLNVLG